MAKPATGVLSVFDLVARMAGASPDPRYESDHRTGLCRAPAKEGSLSSIHRRGFRDEGGTACTGPARSQGGASPEWQEEGSMAHRVNLLGVEIDRVTMAEATALIDGFISMGVPRRVVTVNLDYLRFACQDETVRETINAADLAVADGMPLVWASRLLAKPLPERVCGIDLSKRFAQLASAKGYSLFLLGGAPGVAEAAAQALQTRYPGLRIAGTYAPPMGPFDAEEERKIADTITAASPQLLLVALGAPRQDLWLRQQLPILGVPVAMGVGCTFDVLSGLLHRAPHWMQRYGLEWLYRLRQQPGHLWKRYLIHDMPVLLRLLAFALGRRSPGERRRHLLRGADES